jgi:hypothetical protein
MTNVWKYHKDGRSYLCKDLSFHSTLSDADEWEEQPFTGDRKVVEKSAMEDYNELVDKYNSLLEKYKLLKKAD